MFDKDLINSIVTLLKGYTVQEALLILKYSGKKIEQLSIFNPTEEQLKT